MRSYGTNLWLISQEVLKITIHKTCLDIAIFKLLPHLPGPISSHSVWRMVCFYNLSSHLIVTSTSSLKYLFPFQGHSFPKFKLVAPANSRPHDQFISVHVVNGAVSCGLPVIYHRVPGLGACHYPWWRLPHNLTWGKPFSTNVNKCPC